MFTMEKYKDSILMTHALFSKHVSYTSIKILAGEGERTQPSIVAHACKPSAKGHKFEASLGYAERPYLQRRMVGGGGRKRYKDSENHLCISGPF